METVTITIGPDEYTRVCEGADFVMVDTPADPAEESETPNRVQFVFALATPAPDTEGHILPPNHRHRFTDLELVDLYLRTTGEPLEVTITRSTAP